VRLFIGRGDGLAAPLEGDGLERAQAPIARHGRGAGLEVQEKVGIG